MEGLFPAGEGERSARKAQTMNALLLLGWLGVIVFAVLSIVPLFLLSETSREKTQLAAWHPTRP
jgi:hypothetical protein